MSKYILPLNTTITLKEIILYIMSNCLLLERESFRDDFKKGEPLEEPLTKDQNMEVLIS